MLAGWLSSFSLYERVRVRPVASQVRPTVHISTPAAALNFRIFHITRSSLQTRKLCIKVQLARAWPLNVTVTMQDNLFLTLWSLLN